MTQARLSNYRQSPRKVRLLADLVRGRKVTEALSILDFTAKRAAKPMKKLILSAQANAVNNNGADKDNLVISEIRVDEGFTLKRSKPRARGRAFPIRKRTSHVFVRLQEVVLGEKVEKDEKDVKVKKEDVKVSKVTKKEDKNVAKNNSK